MSGKAEKLIKFIDENYEQEVLELISLLQDFGEERDLAIQDLGILTHIALDAITISNVEESTKEDIRKYQEEGK